MRTVEMMGMTWAVVGATVVAALTACEASIHTRPADVDTTVAASGCRASVEMVESGRSGLRGERGYIDAWPVALPADGQKAPLEDCLVRVNYDRGEPPLLEVRCDPLCAVIRVLGRDGAEWR